MGFNIGISYRTRYPLAIHSLDRLHPQMSGVRRFTAHGDLYRIRYSLI